MTLKEKFQDVQDAYHDRSDECVIVAEEFAIQFLEFVHVNCEEDWGSDNYLYDEESYTIKELLKVFKKERDL